ncbi:hypothetical protein [Chloroflexus sp.]|uniref:hypothetical protein n=1 Tax=Chloroflexus sp. TaxID=1904827 RepID=UPI002ADDE35D|nr:hypothetical protein [Chloroflexus sp.]
MIVHFGANKVPLRFSRTVILWTLAFLIGPWPALSCIIHCLHLSSVDRAGVEYFLCDAPHHHTDHTDTPAPPVRYDVLPLAFIAVAIGSIVIQRISAVDNDTLRSILHAPEPPPPRLTCAGLSVG